MKFKIDTKAVLEVYEAGHSMVEAAKMLGCSAATIARHLKLSGRSRRYKNTGRTPEEHAAALADMQAMREAGHSYREIGEKYGMSHSGVCLALQRNAR